MGRPGAVCQACCPCASPGRYGVYTTMIRRMIPSDGSVVMAYFFGACQPPCAPHATVPPPPHPLPPTTIPRGIIWLLCACIWQYLLWLHVRCGSARGRLQCGSAVASGDWYALQRLRGLVQLEPQGAGADCPQGHFRQCHFRHDVGTGHHVDQPHDRHSGCVPCAPSSFPPSPCPPLEIVPRRPSPPPLPCFRVMPVGPCVLGMRASCSPALSLTIPLSMLADWIFKSEAPTGYLWGGSLCVIMGFVAVSVQPSSAPRPPTGDDGLQFSPVATSSPGLTASPGSDSGSFNTSAPSSQRAKRGQHAIAPV